MADLAQSAVVTRGSYTSGGNNGKKHRYFEVTATLAAMGTAANKVLATAFRLTNIVGCTPLVKTDDTLVIAAGPSTDGSMLLLKAAGTNAPADYTGEFKFIVWGF